MANIYLRKGSDRNTQAYRLRINEHEFYFSYETCIAYSGPFGRFRLPNYWGKTTARHINEMDLRNWPKVDRETMEKTLQSI